jgi:thioredoxin-like negative regulator of GroEL
LARRFKIYGIPVLIYFKDGKAIAQEMGIRSAQELKINVENYLLK